MAKINGLSPEEQVKQQLAQSLNLPVGLVNQGLIDQYKQQANQSIVSITLGGGGSSPTPPVPQPSPRHYNYGDIVEGGGTVVCWNDEKQQGLITSNPGHTWMDGRDGGTIYSCNVCGTREHEHGNYIGVGGVGFLTVIAPAITIKKVTKVKEVKKKVPFESVVMTQEKREEILSAISQFENNDLLFKTWGFNEVFEKGTAVSLLFWGTPGTGKTLCAQAIAEELGAELKMYGMAEIGSSEPGGSERTIQKIFKTAKDFFMLNKKQQVILFDECDALLYDRNKVGVILGAQINTLLTEIERHDGIVIFTTNRLSVLDPALERRIAAKIEFPFPTREQREAIWKRMIPSKAPIAKDVNFKELSMYPLPGGNIKNAVLNAARMATYKKQKHITMNNFVQAIEKEAQAQAEFEANYDRGNEGRGWSTKPMSRDDYGMSQGMSRRLAVDSVFNKKEEIK